MSFQISYMEKIIIDIKKGFNLKTPLITQDIWPIALLIIGIKLPSKISGKDDNWGFILFYCFAAVESVNRCLKWKATPLKNKVGFIKVLCMNNMSVRSRVNGYHTLMTIISQNARKSTFKRLPRRICILVSVKVGYCKEYVEKLTAYAIKSYLWIFFWRTIMCSKLNKIQINLSAVLINLDLRYKHVQSLEVNFTFCESR